MIDGFEITMGGEKYVVPPLNLKGLKKMLPLAEKFAGASTEEQMDLATALLQGALVRNYPEMTIEKIEEITEAKEFFALVESIPKLMEISGLAARGEAQEGGQSTGAMSTGSSQPEPDGDGRTLTT